MKEPKGPHKQVWVKVNAYVDEEVADLVEALSCFPQLRTFSSCQGVVGECLAQVSFRCGRDGKQSTVQFVEWLVPHLFDAVGDSAYLSIYWGTSRAFAKGRLKVRHGVAPRVARALRKIALELPLPDY